MERFIFRSKIYSLSPYSGEKRCILMHWTPKILIDRDYSFIREKFLKLKKLWIKNTETKRFCIKSFTFVIWSTANIATSCRWYSSYVQAMGYTEWSSAGWNRHRESAVQSIAWASEEWFLCSCSSKCLCWIFLLVFCENLKL